MNVCDLSVICGFDVSIYSVIYFVVFKSTSDNHKLIAMFVTVVMVVESTSVSSFKNNLGTVDLSRFLTVVYCYAVYIYVYC